MEADMQIVEVKNRTPDLINQLLEVWENSVRATHLFLSDSEINVYDTLNLPKKSVRIP